MLDDGHSDQVGVLNSPTCYSAHQNGERIERFSRKVFVGGLPPDIDEGKFIQPSKQNVVKRDFWVQLFEQVLWSSNDF